MRKDGNDKEIIRLIMTAFILISFLLLTVFGAGVYGSICFSRQRSDAGRRLSSYLHSAARMNEAGIDARRIEGRDVLVIRDPGTGYGNRIYPDEGFVMEDYGKIDDGLHVSSTVKIAESSRFRIERICEGLLKITTDDGAVFLTFLEGDRR